MKILSFDTSAKTAAAAITEGETILAESASSAGLTHSQALMPMAMALLSAAGMALPDVDALAVSRGPGSFTGIRIGIGLVKGLAQGLGKPCLGVSTLEALAWNFQGFPGLVCPVMDARCKQVYAALFSIEGQGPRRVWADEALSIGELGERLRALDAPVTFVGDGAELCFRELGRPGLALAPPQLRLQKASSVAFAAGAGLARGEGVSPGELTPVYLRLPQAERELNKKLGQGPGGKGTVV